MRIGWLLVLALLACNQPAAAPEPAAQRLARLKEREHGVPCPVFAAGAEVRYSDFALRFEQPILERSAHVLIVPFALNNTTPVAKSAPQGFLLTTRDGVAHRGETDDERVWSRSHGRRVYWELEPLRPGDRVETAFVFDVDPAALAGAVLYMHRVGSVRDRAGYSHEVVYEQAVADLATPATGDAIRGD